MMRYMPDYPMDEDGELEYDDASEDVNTFELEDEGDDDDNDSD